LVELYGQRQFIAVTGLKRQEEVKMYYHSEANRSCKVVVAAVVFLVATVFSASAFGQTIPAGNSDNPSFPTYGNGKIIVRLYTDYFCPPCQAAEPEMAPVLKKLVKKGVVKVSFIDLPTSQNSALYIKYFLYAMKKKNTFANAISVKQALFEAAKNNITDEASLQAHLAAKGIAFTVYDVKPVFKQFNDYIMSDMAGSTPSAVIEMGGNKETVTGGHAIINALNALK
jgi:protein-disulfide isomerase